MPIVKAMGPHTMNGRDSLGILDFCTTFHLPRCCYEATLGEYLVAAWSNRSLFSLMSVSSACCGEIDSSELEELDT